MKNLDHVTAALQSGREILTQQLKPLPDLATIDESVQANEFRVLVTMQVSALIETLVTELGASSDTAQRVAANDLQRLALLIVRNLKREAGTDVDPTRFAISSYDTACNALKWDWESLLEVRALLTAEHPQVRAALSHDRLTDLHEQAKALTEDEQIRVDCYARRFREQLNHGDAHTQSLARLAWLTVDAEHRLEVQSNAAKAAA